MVRFKNRWLLVEFLVPPDPASSTPIEIDGRQIWATLKQSILANFGDVGWGAVGSSLNVKYYSPTTRICIIRVARDHYRIARGALTLLVGAEGHTFIPNVVHVSGTIKHAQFAAIAHNRKIIARFRARAKMAAAYHDSFDEHLRTSTSELEGLQD